MLNKNKRKAFFSIFGIAAITAIIAICVFFATRTHTYTHVSTGDKIEFASYDLTNQVIIDDSNLKFEYDTTNKEAYFKGIEKFDDLFVMTDNEFNYNTLEIPSTVQYNNETYTVTKVYAPTRTDTDYNSATRCYSYDVIRGIIVPDTVEWIEEAAFYYYPRLEYISIPFVGQYAGTDSDSDAPFGSMFSSSTTYYGTTEDTDVPDTTKYTTSNSPLYTRTINNVTYSNVNSISRWYPGTDTTSVVAYMLPEKLTTVVVTSETALPDRAFFELKKVTSITLPDTLSNLNSKSCVSHSQALTSFTFPKTASVIGEQFLSQCSALTTITLPDGITEIPNGMLSDCYRLETACIPASVKNVNKQAFMGCILLKNLRVFTTDSDHNIASYLNETGFKLPASIENIYSGAFSQCPFEDITITATSLQTIGEGAFNSCNNLRTITLPFIGYQRGNSGCIEAMFGYVFGGGTVTQQYTSDSSKIYSSAIPDTLKTIVITDESLISRGSLSNLPNVETIVINPTDSSQVVQEAAFEKNAKLVEISVPYVGKNQSDTRFGNIFGTTSYTGGYLAQGHYIPTTLKKVTVTNMPRIYTGSFRDLTTLTDVTIHPVTTYIEEAIFYNNVNLTNLIVPFAGTQRGEEYRHWWYEQDYQKFNSISWFFSSTSSSAEYGNTVLRKWTGDNYVKYIPNTLSSVTITDETIIGRRVFQGFKSLTSITILNDGTNNVPSSIANGCMYGCSNLTTLVLPYIGRDVNSNGSSGAAYTIGWLFGTNKFDNTYLAYQYDNYYIPNNLSKITIASSDAVAIKVLPNYSFANMPSLESFSTNANVTTLGSYVFYNDSSLSNVTSPNATYTKVGDYAFANCSNVNCIYNSDEDYFVPNTVTTIGVRAFSGTAVSNVDFSTTALYHLSEIQDYAFNSCPNITSVSIPGLGSQFILKSLGTGVFANCENLTNVTLGPYAVGPYMFMNCSSLTSIDLTNVVSYVPDGFLYGCSSLANLTLDTATTTINEYAFYGCSSLTSFDVKGTITKIENHAFTNCTGLKYMLMPRNVATIEAEAFYGCDRDVFFFYVLDPESEWPSGWVDNWNCSYPIYIYGEAQADIFAYEYDSDLRGYKITSVTEEDYFVGTLRIPSDYNGVNIVSLGKGILDDQPRVTSVIIPSTVREICGAMTQTGTGVKTTGALNNNNIITVYYDISVATAKNPGKKYLSTDTATATGEALTTLYGNEYNWLSYGFVYYNDYWAYMSSGSVKVPYLKLSALTYNIDETEYLTYDGTAKVVDVVGVSTGAVVVDAGAIYTDTSNPTPSGLTSYLPLNLFNFTYSNNINASEEALITATINSSYLNEFNTLVSEETDTTNIYNSNGETTTVLAKNKVGSTERLYLGGTGTRNYEINKKILILFKDGASYETTYLTNWYWSTWTTQYVDGIADTNFRMTGKLTTNNTDAGTYKSSDSNFESLGAFIWASSPHVYLGNLNVTDNFEFQLGGFIEDSLLEVVIKPLDVTVKWTKGSWANGSTTYYTDYANTEIDDFYLWEYTGEVITPTAVAVVAGTDVDENPYLGKEIDVITAINGTYGDYVSYGSAQQIYPNYPTTVASKANCTSSATAYLNSTKNYNLVYYDESTNAWKDVPTNSINGRKEIVVRYAVCKKNLTITVSNSNYLIGYDEDYWSNTNLSNSNRSVSISGLNSGSKFAGELRNYYLENNVIQNYVAAGEYYLKQTGATKTYTTSTYSDPNKYIDWNPQVFDFVASVAAESLDFVIYRDTGEVDLNDNTIYLCENDYYNINLEAYVKIVYHEFTPELRIDDAVITSDGIVEIGEDSYIGLTYHTEGKPHRFTIVPAEQVEDSTSSTGYSSVYPANSNILYYFKETSQPTATYFEFISLEEGGYVVGAYLTRKNFKSYYKNYLLRVVKSEYEFKSFTKEYDGEPITPVIKNQPTIDTYLDDNSTVQYYDTTAVASRESLTYTYYQCDTIAECNDSNKLTSAPTEIDKYVVHITADGSDFFNELDYWEEFEITKRTINLVLSGNKLYDGYTYTIIYSLENSDNSKVLDGHLFVGTLSTTKSIPGVYYGTGSHVDEEGETIQDSYDSYWYWKNKWKVYTTLNNIDVSEYYDISVTGSYEIKNRVMYTYDVDNTDLESVESYGAPDTDYNPTSWDGKFDGLPHSIYVFTHNLYTTPTIYYTESEVYNDEQAESASWSVIPLQYFEPGTYSVYFMVASEYYDNYYGFEQVVIEEQIIEYETGETTIQYDGDYHSFEIAVSYPSSALVEYSLNLTSWTTEPYSYRDYMDNDNPNYVRIYYRITADYFESVGVDSEKFVDFKITQEGFYEYADGDFTISSYEEFYDGKPHGITVTNNNSNITDVKIYYSTELSSDLSDWSLVPITCTDYTANAVTVYVRFVDGRYTDGTRYKDTFGAQYYATIYIKRLTFTGITVTSYDDTYDGEYHGVTINGLENYESANYTIYYSKDQNSQNSSSGWTTTAITYKNVSSAAYYVGIKIEAENYVTYYTSGYIRINVAKLKGVIANGNTAYEPYEIEYTAKPVSNDSIPVNTLTENNEIVSGMVHDGVKTYKFYSTTIGQEYDDNTGKWYDSNYYEATTTAISRPTKLGVYYVKITYANSSNCTGRDGDGNSITMVVEGFIEIVARTVTVTYYESQQYTGTALSPDFAVATGTDDVVTLNVELVSPTDITAEQVIEIGTYQYQISINEDTDLYVLPDEFNDPVTFEITKRTLTIYINTTSIYNYNSLTGEGDYWQKTSGSNYDGWSNYMSGTLLTGHVLDLSMKTASYVRATYVYPITSATASNAIIINNCEVLDTNNDNQLVSDYYDITIQAIVRIMFQTKSYNFTDKTIYYDGDAHGLSLSIDDSEIINPVITYTLDDISELDEEGKNSADWSIYSPTFVNAGEYSVYVRIKSDNLEDIYTVAKLVIKKTELEVEITTFDGTIYDALEHEVTAKITNLSSLIANATSPESIRYYLNTSYSYSNLVTAYNVSEFSEINETVFENGLTTCVNAGTYYAVVTYLETGNWKYAYFIVETTIEKKDVQVALGSNSITYTKNYDGKVAYQYLTNATIKTADLINGHIVTTKSISKFRIKTNSSNAGTYGAEDFEFVETYLILDSDNSNADVTKNYHPVITTGIEFIILKISFDFTVAEETTKSYATIETTDGYEAVLASPDMVLPNDLNPLLDFDCTPVYTYYAVTEDGEIGDKLEGQYSDVGDYYVFVTFEEGTNFKAYTEMDRYGLVHITPMEVDVVWSDLEKDFTGSALAPTAKYIDGFGEEQNLKVYIFDKVNNQVVSKSSVIAAGEYITYAEFLATDLSSGNYQLSDDTESTTFIINKLQFTYHVDELTYDNSTNWVKTVEASDFDGFPSALTLSGSNSSNATLSTNAHDVGVYFYGEYYSKRLVFDYKIVDEDDNDLTNSIELIAEGSVIIYSDNILYTVEDIVVPYDGLYHSILEGLTVTNPGDSSLYQVLVKKTTETAYTGNPLDSEYKFMNVGTHTIDFKIVTNISGSENVATDSISITIKQIESSATILGSLDKTYDSLPVTSSTITVSGSYNKHADGVLYYTYFRTDSSYLGGTEIGSTDPSHTDTYSLSAGPSEVGYYRLEITNSADDIEEDEDYIKNYTDLNITKNFEIKHREINYEYEGEQVVLKASYYDGYPKYKDGFEGAIKETATWTYAPDALVSSSIGLASKDELHIVLQSNNNGNALALKNYLYTGTLDYAYTTDISTPTSQNFYSDTDVGNNYFAIIWYVLNSDGDNVSSNYQFNFDFDLDVHYPDIGHTITAPTNNAYGPTSYYYASIAYDETVVSAVTESYSHIAIDNGTSKSSISDMSFNNPGTYSVGYTLTAEGYRTYTGTFIISINYSARTLTTEFSNKKDSLSSYYDGNAITIEDIVGQGSSGLAWYNSVFKDGDYLDSITDEDVTITFRRQGYNSYTDTITNAGTYNYTITVPMSSFYSETVITGVYTIKKAAITISDSEDGYYVANYTGGFAYYTLTETSYYYGITMNDDVFPSGYSFKGIFQTTSGAMGTYTSTAGTVIPISNYTITGGAENYNVTLNMTMKISPGTISATASDVSMEYKLDDNGNPIVRYSTITMITPAKASAIYYSEDGGTNWTTTPIGISTPGEKNILIKIQATNYNDLVLNPTLEITKATTVIEIPSMSREYNGQFVGLPTNIYTNSDVDIQSYNINYYKLTGGSYTVMSTIPKDVGTYKISVEILDGLSNYYTGAYVEQVFTISPKDVAVTWSDSEYIYDGLTHIPSATLNTGLYIGGVLYTPNFEVEVTTFADQSVIISDPWLADVYVATVKVDNDDNWAFTEDEMSTTYSIVKRTITLEIGNSGKVYDGNAQEFVYVGDTSSIDSSVYYYTASNIAKYTVNDVDQADYFDATSVLVTSGSNVTTYTSYNYLIGNFEWKTGDFEIWNLSYDSGNPTNVPDCYVVKYDLSFQIDLEVISYSVSSYEVTYDGAYHSLDITVNNADDPVIYYYDGSAYTIPSTEVKEGYTVFKDVNYDDDGNVIPYTIKFMITVPNHESEKVTRYITINPKAANLYLKDKVLDKEYDGENVDLSAADFDYIDSSSNPRTVTISYEKYDTTNGWLATTDTSNVGKYRVTAELDAGNNKNYSGGSRVIEFEVVKRTITITTLDSNYNLLTKEKTYDALSLQYAVQQDDVLNIVDGDKFAGTVKSKYANVNVYTSQSDFEWVSGYKITKTVTVNNVATKVDVTANYIILFRLRFNIKPATIEYEVTNLSYVYNDNDELVYLEDGVTPKQAVLGTVGGTDTYGITLSVNGPVNYTVTYTYIDETTSTEKTSTVNPKFKTQGEHTVNFSISAANYTTINDDALVLIKGLDSSGGYIDYLPTVTYDSTAYMSGTTNGKPVYVTDSPGVQKITYYTFDGNGYVSLTDTPVNAGTYFLKILVEQSGDYEAYTTPGYTTFTIQKVEREVIFENTEVTYNGEDQKPTAYIYAYDNVNKIYLDVANEYTDANLTGYDITASVADGDETTALNYEITNYNVSNLFVIKPQEVDKPSISTGLEFTYSETYTLNDANGDPICETDGDGNPIYNLVSSEFDSSVTYYTYDEENSVYVKATGITEFDPEVVYYVPQYKEFRFGDEVVVKDTEGNIYVIDDNGTITDVLSAVDGSSLGAPDGAELYKVEISTDRNSDEVMPAGTKHVYTVSLLNDKNYVWTNTNYDDYQASGYDDAYEVTFKINRLEIADNADGLTVSVATEYSYYIMEIDSSVALKPNVTIKLLNADGLFIRNITCGRTSNYEALLTDSDNVVSSAADYNVKGKVTAYGMSNIDFSSVVQYEKRATAPEMFELKDNTIRRFIKLSVDESTKNVTKDFGDNDCGIERTESDSEIFLGRIASKVTVETILADFKNDTANMIVYDKNGDVIEEANYSSKNFGTGFKIELYSDSEHTGEAIDEIYGIVFGDVTGDSIVDGRDLLAEMTLAASNASESYASNPYIYLAGVINSNKKPDGKSLLALMSALNNSVDINDDYKQTPEVIAGLSND